jgi:hypothetical protein
MEDQAYHNKNWTAADFERYHSGEMPAQERHALEKAALDEPFLADALEGYRLTQTPVQDIRELKARLQQKQKSRGPAVFGRMEISRLYKVAAVLILFLGLAWLLKINMPVDQPKEMASVKIEQQIPSNIKRDSFAKLLADSTRATTAVTSSKNIPKEFESPKASSTIPAISKKENPPDDLIVVARERDYADTSAVMTGLSAAKSESQAVEKIDLFSREKAGAPPANVKKAIDGKISGVVIRDQNTIRGRVVDNAGNPVAYANINDRQNNTVLSADQDGYFSLSNRQNAAKVKVDVNAVGFETNNIALNANTAENKIVLKESNQGLSEVVVVGAGTRKRSQVAGGAAPAKDLNKPFSEKLTFTNIIPVTGWNDFNKYIDDSISSNPKYFDKALKAKTLRLTFELDSIGSPKKIQVQNAESDSATALGRRLLEALPPMKKIRKDKKSTLLIRY